MNENSIERAIDDLTKLPFPAFKGFGDSDNLLKYQTFECWLVKRAGRKILPLYYWTAVKQLDFGNALAFSHNAAENTGISIKVKSLAPFTLLLLSSGKFIYSQTVDDVGAVVFVSNMRKMPDFENWIQWRGI